MGSLQGAPVAIAGAAAVVSPANTTPAGSTAPAVASSTSKPIPNPLRASRGARPQEVYHAAVQHLERTLASTTNLNEEPAALHQSSGAEKFQKRASVEGFRPGALSALASAPPRRMSADLATLSHDSLEHNGDAPSSFEQASNGSARSGLPASVSAVLSAETQNRGLSLPVTDNNPLGQDCTPPPVSPVALHAPAAVSRNLTINTPSPSQSSGTSATHGQSRPPSSRLRYDTSASSSSAIQRRDGARIPVPSRGAASALRETAAPDNGKGGAAGNELLSYLERLNSTLQQGGGAEDVLATSMDAGAPTNIRRRPSINVSSRPSSAVEHRSQPEHLPANCKGSDGPKMVSRAQQLLTQAEGEPVVSSPKGPYSKSAQMLVDAVRSKDDLRLREVLAQLSGFADSGTVKGIDDRHAVTGRTALHEAVMLNRLTSVQIILQAGADPNVAHVTQGPPLLHAAAWGETALVEAMVLCGSDINAVDCAEYTALHYAAVGDHVETARTLVHHGASLEACNDEMRAPADLATSDAMLVLLNSAKTSPVKSRTGAHKATPQEVQAALDLLGRASTPTGSITETSPTSTSFHSPSSTSSPSYQVASHRPALRTSMSGARITDILTRLDRQTTDLSRPAERNREAGEGWTPGQEDSSTPPLLPDVSPPDSPSYRQSSTPRVKMRPRGEPGGERIGTPPMLLRENSSRPSTSGRSGLPSRPGTGNVWDPSSGKNLSNPRAAEVALRAANATGSPAAGLNHRAAQMFYQSVEMHVGDITWTQGELIGEGAYGKVYSGLNQHSGELMAVKVLPLSSVGDDSEQRSHLEALEHELGMYKKFKHRHIVGYIAAHMDFKNNTMYIFLEYVPGGSISSMLERFGSFSEDLTRKYTRELLLGLEYLHGCKVIHRDLKGANVLVTRSGRVKLTDFGASKAYHEATITDGMKSIRGSVFWMAPEVIKGTGYGRRADIWSVGCTALEMLTAKHPWPALDNHWSAMFAIAKAKEGPPIPDNLSPMCRDFLQCCLQVDARKRPTATEMLQHPFVNQIPDALRDAEMGQALNHSL